MGALLIVIALVAGAAAWEIGTEVGGEYLAMFIIEPIDLGASKRVPNTLNDGQARPTDIVEGKVSNVLLAAYDPAAGNGTPIPARVSPKTPRPSGTSPAAKAAHDGDGGAAATPPKENSAPGRGGVADGLNGGPELGALLALIGDAPRRELDGTIFLPIVTQRVFGLRTMLGERISVPVTQEMPGHIVVDPASSTLIQVGNKGFIEAANGRFPFIGQTVTRGDLLALMQPINDHLGQAHTLERIQDLTNQIDMARKRMARLEEVIYIRYRDSKIEALRVEITGLQRQLDVLRDAIEMRYELRAKTDGIVSRVEAQVGQYVDQGQTIFEIVDPSRLWVEATAFEPYQAGQVQDATAFTPDGKKLALRFVGGGLKLRNQATPLRFEIINPVSDLTVDNPVTVVVRSRTGAVSGIKVPRSALLHGADGRQIVWERRSAERFVGHHVSSQSIDAGYVLITEGLPASLRVVLEGAAILDQVR